MRYLLALILLLSGTLIISAVVAALNFPPTVAGIGGFLLGWNVINIADAILGVKK